MDLFFLILIMSFCVLFLIKATKMTAPYVPSHGRDLERVKQLIEKYQIKSVLDLGCGLGGILNYLNNQFPTGKFCGIEISPLFFFLAKIRLITKKNIQIKFGNCFKYDWSGYDALFMFWLPKSFEKYESAMLEKFQPGQYVISYTFPIEWLKDKLLESSKLENQLPIYVYKI